MAHSDNKLFYKMLISFSVIVSFTIAILSSILYINFESITTNLIYNTSREKLYQSSYSVKFLSQIVEGIAIHINSDAAVKSLMSPKQLDPVEMNYALNRLQAYRFASPMINSIYVYNRSSSEIFSSSSTSMNMISKKADFYDKDIIEILPNLNKYKRFSPIPRKVIVPNSDNVSEVSDVYTYVYYDFYSSTNTVDNVVILNISASWLFNTINAMDIDSSMTKDIIIVDSKGRIVFSKDSNKMTTDGNKEGYINNILKSDRDSHYFLDSIEGNKYLITYVKSEYYDWNFVSLIPYEAIVGKINRMKSITLLVSLILLLISITSSLLLSKRLYVPIQQIFSRLSSLEKEKAAARAELKEKMLSGLLSGSVDENNGDLIEEFRASGDLKIDIQGTVLVLLLKVDNYGEYRSRHKYNTRRAMKVKVYEATKEILFPGQSTEFVDMEEGKLVIIANYNTESSNNDLVKQGIGSGINNLQAKLLDITGKTFSIFISPLGYTYRDLPYIYTEALNLSKYRFVFGHKSVIYFTDLPETSNITFDYPHSKEKLLIEAIMLEKQETALEAYRNIVEQMGVVPEEIYRHTLNQLYIVIKSTFLSKINDSDVLSGSFNSVYEKLQKSETLDDADICFNELFNLIFLYFADMKKKKYDELIKFITSYVEENYTSNILSVNVIADEVKMSAAYLGKLFKQITSKSIPDYISEIRLNKSKELLSESTISVNEIAEKVGFTNSSYYYMVFKKEYGMTPNQYRQQNHNK